MRTFRRRKFFSEVENAGKFRIFRKHYTKKPLTLNAPLPPSLQMVNDILRRDELGEELADKFIDERLVQGLKSIWDPMAKSKIRTFSSTAVTVDPKTAKVKRVKEDNNMFQRFIIVSRTRTDLDMKDLISKYEFGNLPRSLFSLDGNLLYALDKAKLVRQLESLEKNFLFLLLFSLLLSTAGCRPPLFSSILNDPLPIVASLSPLIV